MLKANQDKVEKEIKPGDLIQIGAKRFFHILRILNEDNKGIKLAKLNRKVVYIDFQLNNKNRGPSTLEDDIGSFKNKIRYAQLHQNAGEACQDM